VTIDTKSTILELGGKRIFKGYKTILDSKHSPTLFHNKTRENKSKMENEESQVSHRPERPNGSAAAGGTARRMWAHAKAAARLCVVSIMFLWELFKTGLACYQLAWSGPVIWIAINILLFLDSLYSLGCKIRERFTGNNLPKLPVCVTVPRQELILQLDDENEDNSDGL
jgi:hypothetical protein